MPGNRKSIRLRHYNYSQDGAYYITVCAGGYGCRQVIKNAQNRDVFGHVADGKMVLNQYGAIIDKCWNEIPDHFPHIELDEHIVMPNHVHGIIIRRGTACRAPTMDDYCNITIERFGKPVSGSLSTIIRSFKSAAMRLINQSRDTPGARLWQRNYYEHVIRNESDLAYIREYIVNNPAAWEKDEYYFA